MPENEKAAIFTAEIGRDMERVSENRTAFRTRHGRYDAAAWLEFVTQFNAYAGHPRRPFTPITGDNFRI